MRLPRGTPVKSKRKMIDDFPALLTAVRDLTAPPNGQVIGRHPSTGPPCRAALGQPVCRTHFLASMVQDPVDFAFRILSVLEALSRSVTPVLNGFRLQRVVLNPITFPTVDIQRHGKQSLLSTGPRKDISALERYYRRCPARCSQGQFDFANAILGAKPEKPAERLRSQEGPHHFCMALCLPDERTPNIKGTVQLSIWQRGSRSVVEAL